jgi:hypothetical protein
MAYLYIQKHKRNTVKTATHGPLKKENQAEVGLVEKQAEAPAATTATEATAATAGAKQVAEATSPARKPASLPPLNLVMRQDPSGPPAAGGMEACESAPKKILEA